MSLRRKIKPRRASYWKIRRMIRRGLHYGGWRFVDRPRTFKASIAAMRARMAMRRKVGR